MCQYANDLAATGAPLYDDELVAYILAGLDEDYNSVFTVVVVQTDPNMSLNIASHFFAKRNGWPVLALSFWHQNAP
jgi:hypothetical protein